MRYVARFPQVPSFITGRKINGSAQSFMTNDAPLKFIKRHSCYQNMSRKYSEKSNVKSINMTSENAEQRIFGVFLQSLQLLKSGIENVCLQWHNGFSIHRFSHCT